MRKHSLLLSLAILVSALAPVSALASDVLPGYDLFQSTSGTTFNGVPFTGVPLGSYNFGGSIGTKVVGNADTIVHRLNSATVGVPPGTAPTIPIEMVALQLVSTAPTNLGLGTGFYYITLQSARGGTPTQGTMDINFANDNGGTFTSFFDVFFDIRLGDLNGPIALSGDLTLNGNDSWTRTPTPGAVTIPGVNSLLNGTNTTKDFWPGVPFSETHPGTGPASAHVVTDAILPLPAAVWPAALLLGLLGVSRRVRRGNT